MTEHEEAERETSEAERFYDDVLAPALKAISDKCVDKGMSFLAVVEYERGERGRTAVHIPEQGLAMTMLHHCARTGENIDGYVIGLLRHANEHVVDYSSSIVMNKMAGKWP